MVEVALLAWPSSIYLWYQFREVALPASRLVMMGFAFALAAALALGTFWTAMQKGVRALEDLGS